MDIYFLGSLGKIAGIAGIAVGILFLIYREIIRKKIFPMLTKKQAFTLLLLIVIVVWTIAVLAIFVWKSDSTLSKSKEQAGKNGEVLSKTFTFVDFADVELVRIIEGATELKYDLSNNATYNIRLTNTGSLRPAYQDGYYLFDGGVAVVFVNDSKCCEINSIRLKPWSDSPGNPQDLLENNIEKELNQKLKQNRNLVAECLIECLRNED